ncbi:MULTISPECIES: type VI secretion system protein IglI family protein [Corallococcus]|nr:MULTISPECIES: type VI secretion system protein IglI family protein [Corallococcus]
MRDLSLCLRPVEGGTLERLEAHDQRFLTVADLVQRESYAQAADAIEALDGEGVYEVRLSAYYLFAALREEGLARLPDVLETLAGLTRAAAEAAGQGEGRDKAKPVVLLNKALTWLFQTLLSALRYHHGKKDAGWEAWTKGFTDGKRRDALRGIQTLQALLEGPAFRNGSQGLAGLGQWLRETQERPAAAAPPAEPAKPAAPTKTKGAKAAAAPASPFPRATGPLQLRGSVHLLELCDKLKAFEVLVERGDFQKAAMVSDDVLRTLEDFDPRRYLPELFSMFGALLNRHVGDIQEHWERKDTLEWRTLSQFYQVDLGAFVGPGE